MKWYLAKEAIMKRTVTRLLIISSFLAVASFSTSAQVKEREPAESTLKGSPALKGSKTVDVELPDATFKLLTSKFASGKVVKGAPYSATAITEHIQTLSDGNQIVRKNESKLYRDSEGRTRMEQTLETIGKWTASGEAPRRVFINDPVARLSYTVDPRAQVTEYTLSVSKGRPGRAGKVYRLDDKVVTQRELEATVRQIEAAHRVDVMRQYRLKPVENDVQQKTEAAI